MASESDTASAGEALYGSASARPAEDVSDPAAAAVVAGTVRTDGGRLLVRVADSWVEIKELQLAGKKRMAADAFLRGFREIESYKFV